MSKAFNDHFKTVSAHYASSRPTYPSELFAWLAGQCAARELAWDCATGNGQAALDLAGHFRRVVASDASAAQLAAASAHSHVEYRVAPAEASGLPEGAVDLVTVAQALHWFDLDAFHAEVRRVLKPDGLLAVWSYGVLSVEGEALDRHVQRFYWEEIGPYWPAERRHVENGYRELPFPFHPVAAPAFAMRVQWDLAHFLGYLRSWSATARYVQTHGQDPVETLATRLAPLWGETRTVSWPLALRVGRP